MVEIVRCGFAPRVLCPLMPADLDELALAEMLVRCDTHSIAGAVCRLGEEGLDKLVEAVEIAASMYKPVGDLETMLREFVARVDELRGQKP